MSRLCVGSLWLQKFSEERGQQAKAVGRALGSSAECLNMLPVADLKAGERSTHSVAVLEPGKGKGPCLVRPALQTLQLCPRMLLLGDGVRGRDGTFVML